MAAGLEDVILDGGLTLLDQNATHVWITKDEPITIAIATAGTAALGFKSVAAGTLFGAPATNSTTVVGRQVTSIAVSDGTVITTGTAAWWAVGVAGTLHAHGSITTPQLVSAGNTYTLTAINIKIPNAAA